MKRLLAPQWFLILAFLGIIGAVPIIQMGMEIRQGEDVRALEVLKQAPTAAHLRAYERAMESVNWAARASRPWMQYALFSWFKEGGEKMLAGQGGWYFYRPGVNYLLSRPEPAKETQGANDPVSAIVDFRDQLAARGIRLMVLPVPNKESIYPDRLTTRVPAGRGVVSPRTREVLSRLRAADVEVLDLFAVLGRARLTNESPAGPSLYLAQDTHWSPAGVRVAAKAVARRLLELGWVRAGAVDYVERPAPVERLGDIVRMLQSPGIERSLAPELVPCVQVLRRDNGELYRDAPEAEVLVLGDSFMRIYQQDEPGAAGFMAHLALNLRQPLLGVINDGGGSTLVRQELSYRAAFLRNRKVVLWEFVERDIGLGLEGWQLVRLPAVAETAPTAPGQQALAVENLAAISGNAGW